MNLFFIILLLFIFTIISCKRLELGLYLICFLLPSYLIRFKIGPIPFTALEGMILILFLIWIIKEIYHKNLLNILKKLPQCKFFWPIILFVVTTTISIFISPDLKEALGIWKAYFIEPLLLFLVFVHVIKTKEQINKIIWSLGLSAIIIAIIAIVQYMSGFGIPESYNLPNIKRATAVYGYPSAVGLFLAPILTLFIGMFIGKCKNQNEKCKMTNQNVKINNQPNKSTTYEISEKSVKTDQILNLSLSKNIFSKASKFHTWSNLSSLFNLSNNNKLFSKLLVIILLSIAIILAKTEGAAIAVLVSTFFILIFTKYRKFVIAGTLIIILLIFLIPSTRDYAITLLTFKDVSGDVRIALWQGTLRLIKNNPIFGAGLAGFPYLYEKYKEAKHVEISLYPHNIFLDFWVEAGILGLISLLWIIINFFKKGFDKITRPNYQLTLMGVMICTLVYGLVDTPYFKNDLSCLFWIWIGLLTVVTNKDLRQSAPVRR